MKLLVITGVIVVPDETDFPLESPVTGNDAFEAFKGILPLLFDGKAHPTGFNVMPYRVPSVDTVRDVKINIQFTYGAGPRPKFGPSVWQRISANADEDDEE